MSMPLFGPEHAEFLHLVRRSLHPEHVSCPGMRLAVAFHRVAVQPVLDPLAGSPPFEIGCQFTIEPFRYAAVQADLFAEKLHHVRTGKAEHAVFEKPG
jgi:hypothetical protein